VNGEVLAINRARLSFDALSLRDGRQSRDAVDRTYEVMANPALGDICKKCAECCRHYPFIELSKDDIHALKKFTGLHVDAFTNPRNADGEGHILKFKENGDCLFLNENSGGYFCAVYEARSAVCRDYPSIPSQNKICDANRRECQTQER